MSVKYCKDAGEQNQERKEEFKKHENTFLGGKKAWSGEILEMKLYKALQKRFETKDENIAIFHSLEILKFDQERQDNNVYEKDFVLVSASHAYIMAIGMSIFLVQNFTTR